VTTHATAMNAPIVAIPSTVEDLQVITSLYHIASHRITFYCTVLPSVCEVRALISLSTFLKLIVFLSRRSRLFN
jgi:hypothetical protein